MNDLIEGKEFFITRPELLRELVWGDISKRKLVLNEQTKKEEPTGDVYVVPGIEYFVMSFYTGYYEKYTTTVFTVLSELMPFKKNKQIFIKTKL